MGVLREGDISVSRGGMIGCVERVYIMVCFKVYYNHRVCWGVF